MEKQSLNQGKITVIIRTIGSTSSEEHKIDGRTALDIISKNHIIETIKTGSNEMVKCIDDVCAKNSYWWKFFANEKLSLISIDKYYPKDKDIILLEYGEN
ncbi:MAG: DUF4430 domain-containing protein [Candidatus Woesearchaeota archaeon]|nr:hypothetical protein [archaeon]MDP6600481.1 DUF4430 domain-containing protein [Candidatus Woesearchaeota archaeon]MDP7263854.1 DUF4430 domain-containing protein [Candidatus Woesearchaeota archaeon]HJN56556.1 DUF4430 domain-containing protein [Candidatus Woesearchaeota archaeon]